MVASDDQVERLLHRLEKLQLHTQHEQATAVLKEVSIFAPSDPRVVQAWKNFLSQESEMDVYTLCKLYAETGQQVLGESALKVTATAESSLTTAEKAIEVLLNSDRNLELKADLIYATLSKSNGRAALANLISVDPNNVLKTMLTFRHPCTVSLVSTLLTPQYWKSEEVRSVAVLQVCTLLLTQLRDHHRADAELAVQTLAQLTSSSGTELLPIIIAQNVDTLLYYLDVGQSQKCRIQTLLVVTRFHSSAPELFNELVIEFMKIRMSSRTNDELHNAISVAGAMFSVIPKTTAAFFLTEGVLGDILGLVTSSTSQVFCIAVLELLSAACVDKECRKVITAQCISWLEELLEHDDDPNPRNLAALVMTKLGGRSSKASAGSVVKDRSERLVWSALTEAVKSGDGSAKQIGVEGLAYITMQPKCKELLTRDPGLMRALFQNLERSDGQGALIFGELTIMSNVVSYTSTFNQEQKRMNEIKAYANQSRLDSADPLDSDDRVDARCDRVMSAGLLPTIIKIAKNQSPAVVQLVAGILLSLSRAPTRRGRLIQQGMYDVIVRYANISQSNEKSAREAQQKSAFSLARLLVSTNPALIYQSRSIEPAIWPLKELLRAPETDDSPFVSAHGRDLQPVFESLRALTNIASLGEQARLAIISQAFPLITTQLWSNNLAIVQAAVECFVNLTESYSAVESLLHPTESAVSLSGAEKPQNSTGNIDTNGGLSISANNTIHLITALMQSHVSGIRRAATAVTAHVLAWHIGVVSFLRLEKGIETLLACVKEAVNDGDEDLLLRAIMAIWLLLITCKEGERGETANTPDSMNVTLLNEAILRIKRAGGTNSFQMLMDAGIGRGNDTGNMIDSILTFLKP